MNPQSLITALGAGAASAALFALQARGEAAPGLLGLFAPLPLMIVGLGYGERLALLAAAVTLALVLALFDPFVCAVAFISVAAPALVLTALSSREKTAGPGWLLLACALLSILLILIVISAEIWGGTSFDAALAEIAEKMKPAAEAIFNASGDIFGDINPNTLARLLALALMPAAAAWGVVGFAVNLWLAGRATAVSGLLQRPWPDLPSTLRLPRPAFVGVGLAAVACLSPGVIRVMAACALAALLTAFAISGLAALHGVTRGRAGRPAVLSGFYVLCFALFPWPLIVMAGLGIADVVRPLRRGGDIPTPSQP